MASGAALQLQLRPRPHTSVWSAKVSRSRRNAAPVAGSEDIFGRLNSFFNKLKGEEEAEKEADEKTEKPAAEKEAEKEAEKDTEKDAKKNALKDAEKNAEKEADKAEEAKVAAPSDSVQLAPVASAEDSKSKSSAAPPPEDDEPIFEEKWVDLDMTKADAQPREGALTMPVFPLGPYVPYTEQVLNIFEPRYRKMYDDIIFSGGRRFMVCDLQQKGTSESIAETGVIFYLDDLKEVSESTGDKVKYIGTHSVTGRVKAKRVLNPKAWRTRETYLKAEVEIIEDTDEAVDTTEAEADVRKRFLDLIKGQTDLNEHPRFSNEVKDYLNFGRQAKKEDTGLWDMVNLWSTFVQQRDQVILIPLQREMQAAFQREISKYDLEAPPSGRIHISDLPEELQQKLSTIRSSFSEKIEDLAGKVFQKQYRSIIQSDSHAERLSMFRYVIDTERKRIAAKTALKNMFAE